jgi:hypothetical protein
MGAEVNAVLCSWLEGMTAARRRPIPRSRARAVRATFLAQYRNRRTDATQRKLALPVPRRCPCPYQRVECRGRMAFVEDARAKERVTVHGRLQDRDGQPRRRTAPRECLDRNERAVETALAALPDEQRSRANPFHLRGRNQCRFHEDVWCPGTARKVAPLTFEGLGIGPGWRAQPRTSPAWVLPFARCVVRRRAQSRGLRGPSHPVLTSSRGLDRHCDHTKVPRDAAALGWPASAYTGASITRRRDAIGSLARARRMSRLTGPAAPESSTIHRH